MSQIGDHWTVGRLDILQESGQLDQLLRSGLRYCSKVRVLDAHAPGETKPVVRRLPEKIGADLVFGRLWKELGMAEVIGRELSGRNFGFDVERAVYLTALHRLFASGSDRAAERWKEGYAIEGVAEIDLHQLYRAMGWLGEPIEEGVLGSPRCIKDLIEEGLFERRRDLFSEVGLIDPPRQRRCLRGDLHGSIRGTWLPRIQFVSAVAPALPISFKHCVNNKITRSDPFDLESRNRAQ